MAFKLDEDWGRRNERAPTSRRAMRNLIRWENKKSIGNYAGRPRRAFPTESSTNGSGQGSGNIPPKVIQASSEFCRNSEAPSKANSKGPLDECWQCGVKFPEATVGCKRCRGRLRKRVRRVRQRKVGVR